VAAEGWRRAATLGRDSELGTMLGGQSELGAAASTKAVWWDLRLASLLTHLLKPNSITLAGSKLVAHRFEAGRRPASNLLA